MGKNPFQIFGPFVIAFAIAILALPGYSFAFEPKQTCTTTGQSRTCRLVLDNVVHPNDSPTKSTRAMADFIRALVPDANLDKTTKLFTELVDGMNKANPIQAYGWTWSLKSNPKTLILEATK
jgi:hypothetical protein